MKNMGVFLAAVFIVAQSTQAEVPSTHQHKSHETNCFPGNKQERPINHSLGFVKTGISEARFNQIIDRAEAIYKPIFEKRGWKLKFHRLWENPQVNAKAYPTLSDFNERNVEMYGGMARHENITEDAFTLVACHEIGHHIGGAPNTDRVTPFGVFTPANEGQSDYFATLKCARRIFSQDDNIARLRGKMVPKVVLEKCRESFRTSADIALCVRSGIAAKDTASLLAVLMGLPQPDYSTPDTTQVTETYNGHPQAQCRLDTSLQGALCNMDVNMSVSDTDANVGACSRQMGDTLGVRPLCWYKPDNRTLLLSSNLSL